MAALLNAMRGLAEKSGANFNYIEIRSKKNKRLVKAKLIFYVFYSFAAFQVLKLRESQKSAATPEICPLITVKLK